MDGYISKLNCKVEELDKTQRGMLKSEQADYRVTTDNVCLRDI